MNNKEAEGLLGCVAVPVVIVFLIWVVWPSPSANEVVRRGAQRDEKIAAAKERIKADLRDPSSAEFFDTDIHGLSTVCGRVNARNGFGGMTGPKRFMTTGRYVLFEDELDKVAPGSFAKDWQERCV